MSTLQELFDELALVVDAGDADRAYDLARQIEANLVADADEARAEADEERLRALLDRLVPAQRASASFIKGFESTKGDDLEGEVQPVWFGTNRRQAADGTFTHERSDAVTRGRVDVFVPDGHKLGSSGSSFWQKLKALDFTDDTLRIQELTVQDRTAFFDELRARVAKDPQKHALFFLHGYKNTFEDAAIRAAQLAFDLGVPGPTAFFSWPSRGKVRHYPADGETIAWSEPHIREFFVDFVAHCGADTVHVIAHSMGNRALLGAIKHLTASTLAPKLGQVFLAAPDVDAGVFVQQAPLFDGLATRTTLYASNGDRAVQVAAWLADAPRAGYFEPYTFAPKVDTIAVPDFDIDLLGHSYFAQARPMLQDIQMQMLVDQPPGKARHMLAVTHPNGTSWTLR